MAARAWVPIDRRSIPKLITAFVAVEDRRFLEHGGIDWRAVRARRMAQPSCAPRRVRRVDDHDAARAAAAPHAAQLAAARSCRRCGRCGSSAHLEQAADPRAVSESRPARPGRGRCRRGERALLRRVGSRAEPRAGRDARRHRARAVARQPARLAGARARAPGARARAHARRGLRHRSGRRARTRGAGARGGGARAVPRAAFHHARARRARRDARPSRRDDASRTSLDSRCSARSRPRCGTRSTMLRDRGVRAGGGGRARQRERRGARVGRLARLLGGRRRGRRTWSSRRASPAPRSSRFSTASRSIAASRRRACSPTSRTYATSTGPYHPRNYDRRFHGPVRAREALASSYNVPAVELAQRARRREPAADAASRRVRVAPRDAEYYGLGLALGNGDVTLLELANGYRALANRGEWRPVHHGRAGRAAERRSGRFAPRDVAARCGARARHPRRSRRARARLRHRVRRSSSRSLSR